MAVIGGNTINHAVAYPGMAINSEVVNKVGKLNGTTAVIPFGKGVVTDTTVTTAAASRLPVVTDTNALAFNGVAFYELNRAYTAAQSIGAVPDYDFDVVTIGAIWVIAQTLAAVNDPVYLITDDAGTTSNEGDFMDVATSGAYTGLLIPNAKYVIAPTAVGEIAKISFSIGG